MVVTHGEPRRICKPWPIRGAHGIRRTEPGSPCSRENDQATERWIAFSPAGARPSFRNASRCIQGPRGRTPLRHRAGRSQCQDAIDAEARGGSDNTQKENHPPGASAPLRHAATEGQSKALRGAHALCAKRSTPMAKGFSQVLQAVWEIAWCCHSQNAYATCSA